MKRIILIITILTTTGCFSTQGGTNLTGLSDSRPSTIGIMTSPPRTAPVLPSGEPQGQPNTRRYDDTNRRY